MSKINKIVDYLSRVDLAKNKTFMTDLATYLENAKLSEDYLLNMDNAISLGIKNVLADNKYSYNKKYYNLLFKIWIILF